MRTTDPIEQILEAALIGRGHDYQTEGQRPPLANGRRLDFYLPQADLYIEVKRMHSPRISEQMAGTPNVIAAQGEQAVRWLAEAINPSWRPLSRTSRPRPGLPLVVLLKGQGYYATCKISDDFEDEGLHISSDEGTWNLDLDAETDLPSHFFQLPELPALASPAGSPSA